MILCHYMCCKLNIGTEKIGNKFNFSFLDDLILLEYFYLRSILR